MMKYKAPKEVSIVYFTGTGSTKRVAKEFEKGFVNKDVRVNCYEINHNNIYNYPDADLLLLIYPVYALNAPEPIYDFIRKLPDLKKCPAAVISVSGGGEITPNTACRLHCIRRLEKKGFPVIYERMVVMPSNFLAATPKELSARLFEVLPDRVCNIINDILAGVSHRTKPSLLNRALSCVGELEKSRVFGGKAFGHHMKVNKSCTGCGLCRKGCPTGNISMKNNIPVFGHQCAICLKCIYSCPKKALRLGIGNFIVLKQGYNVKELEIGTSVKDPADIKKLYKGYSLSGIRKYLLEKD